MTYQYLCIFLLILLYGFLTSSSMIRKSATYDEQVYVLAGYSFLETGEYCLKQDAPPLIPVLSALSIKIDALIGEPLKLDDSIKSKLGEVKRLWLQRSSQSTKEYDLGIKFFHQNNGPRLIQIARIPIVVLGMLLVWYFFWFAKELFGFTAAIPATLLLVIDPNLIGHGRVVSADLGLACFFLISHFYHYQVITRNRQSDLFGLAIAVSLCVAVKLSGLIVFISLSMVTLLVLLRPPATVLTAMGLSTRDFKQVILRKAAVGAAGSLIAAYLMISILFGTLKSPANYYQATQLIYSNMPDSYQSFLMGAYQEKFWYYYFLAIFFKSPIGLTGLFLASILFSKCQNELGRFYSTVPFALALILSSFDAANIGLRRVLLCIPFAYLSIGGLIRWSFEPKKFRTIAIAIISGFFVWMVYAAITIYPHHLSFFNHLVGGPSSGHKYLAESNISWGQNLPALSRYLKEQGISKVRLHYYGNDEPADYGIEKEKFSEFDLFWPIQDVYVLSAHSMVQFASLDDEGSNWFTRFEPTAVIDHTLFVFDLRDYPEDQKRSPERSLALARNFVAKKDFGPSIHHFQSYLSKKPTDEIVHRELAAVAQQLKHKSLEKHHIDAAEKLASIGEE